MATAQEIIDKLSKLAPSTEIFVNEFKYYTGGTMLEPAEVVEDVRDPDTGRTVWVIQ
ncbi:hypothetical protein OG436_29565 [Streptomyces caniferus]|uniref:hypothetical protein n=1 Tax=Streptomyces caniferus TaxID=285557 RepID=UPI002E2987B3|nr:hypothetical protein [Streptomyces caniferus]